MLNTLRKLNLQFFSAKRSRRHKASYENINQQVGMEKNVYNSYRKQVQSSSVLRQFRRQVYRRSELNQQHQKVIDKIRQQDEMLSQLVSQGSKQQIIRKAESAQQRIINQRSVFHLKSNQTMLSDYGNYTSYNQVYPEIQDRNLTEFQSLDDSKINQELYKFVDNLSGYQEKKNLRSQINKIQLMEWRNISLTDYGKIMKIHEDNQKLNTKINHEQQMINNLDRMKKSQKQQSNIKFEQTSIHRRNTDILTGKPGIIATLSPKAHDTIYDLYLQGWSVRQISKRFGIHPSRAKFCIWTRAQLYNEIIPKLGVQYYIGALRQILKTSEDSSRIYCDYGLDLENLTNDAIIQDISEWNDRMLDVQRDPDQYVDSLKKLEKKKIFDRYQMVEVGTVGKQNAIYSLREWHIFRGKGSDQYFLKNVTFRSLTRAHKKFNKVYY